MINVVDKGTIEKVQTLLQNVPKGTERALSNAINRAISKAKTEANKGVRKEYAIKSSAVREYTNEGVKKATQSDIEGSITFAGAQIPLYKYNPTSPKHPVGGTVKAGQKSAHIFNKAFIARMPTGHIGIYQRAGKSRFPILEILGSSMRSMVRAVGVEESMEEEAKKTFEDRLDHEIMRILEGYGGK